MYRSAAAHPQRDLVKPKPPPLNKHKDGAAPPVPSKRKLRGNILTLGNVVISLWLPYVVERPKSQSPKQGGKRRKITAVFI